MQVPRLGTGLWALLLSAAILLAACGDDDGSDLQVRASVDGEDVVASPIGADAEEAIEVPSGSLLELDAKAAVTLSTDSDAATIETASPERHKVRFVSPGGATVVLRVASLADGGTARLTVRVLPQRFDNHFRRAGQRLSYRVVKRGLDGKVASETGEIDRVGSVATNGDYTLVLADYSTPTQGEYYVVFFDADGNELGYDSFVWITVEGERYDDGNSCRQRWSGTAQVFPIYVGKRWSSVADGNACSIHRNLEHEVLRYAVVKTPAGAFASLLRRRTPVDDVQRAEECWWAVETGLNVRCTSKWFDERSGNPPRELGTITRELVSVSG